jgi:putative mRNA 3-end processing factor
MKFSFLGGAEEVGMAGILFDLPEYRFLLDYGFTPGKPPSFPKESPNIDFCLLTHAHVDHSGLIPWLSSARGPRIFATTMTQSVTEILARDNLKVSKLEGYSLPFSEGDVASLQNYFEPIEYGEKFELGEIDIRGYSSGHIPGSTMFEINNGSRTLITGDMNTVDSMLIDGVKPIKCDNLFIESTYAGREHPNREELVKEFRDDVSDTIKRGGVAVIPAFAVARSQEVAMMLEGLGIDVYLDGMSKRIATTFLSNGKFLRSENKLKKALNHVKFINNDSQRKKLLKNGGAVITTSGMLDGGPALFYIKRIKDDEKNSIFLTGYQVEGTNGRRLLDTGMIELDGDIGKPKCNVRFFDFSAHADHKALVKFIDDCSPENVVLYHGDKRELLAKDLSNYNVLLPKDGENYEIA